MCVICVSNKGVAQPTKEQIIQMFNKNPDGAGYMYARNGLVYISKGFLNLNDFLRDVESHNFKKSDAVVYHFRIATQGKTDESMTHPFALTSLLERTKKLDDICKIGVAHNGIIPLTQSFKKGEEDYSDTALFIAHYLSKIIKDKKDLKNYYTLNMIEKLGNSKFAIMDGNGYIATVGQFYKKDNGLLFSNLFFEYYPSKKNTSIKDEIIFGDKVYPINEHGEIEIDYENLSDDEIERLSLFDDFDYDSYYSHHHY